MTFYRRQLKQTATYWSPGTRDSFGNITFGAPVAIPCRWEDKSEQFMSRGTEEIISSSIVFINQDVVEGGYMFLGTSAAADPEGVEGAVVIQKFEKIPDIRGRNFVRKAIL